jgi:hypothetical protein
MDSQQTQTQGDHPKLDGAQDQREVIMPYAPGITYDFSSIARGIESLGENIGAGIQQYHKNKEEGDALEQVGQFLMKKRAEKGIGIDAGLLEKFSKGSLGAKRAIIGQLSADTWSEIERLNRLAETQPQRDLAIAQIKRVNEEIAGAKAEREGGQRFMRNLSSYLGAPDTIRRKPSPELLLQLAADAGLPPDRIPTKLIEQFEPKFQPGTMRSIEGLPGYGFVIQSPSGGGSPVPLPQTEEATSRPGATTPILDDKGQPLGRMYFDGKAWRRLPDPPREGLTMPQELAVRARIDKLKKRAQEIALFNQPDAMRALREEVQTLEALLPDRESSQTPGQAIPPAQSPSLSEAFKLWRERQGK